MKILQLKEFYVGDMIHYNFKPPSPPRGLRLRLARGSGMERNEKKWNQFNRIKQKVWI